MTAAKRSARGNRRTPSTRSARAKQAVVPPRAKQTAAAARPPRLPAEYARLVRAAGRARRRAYAPYSQFPVGAAVLANDGTIYAGCNVENASYGLALCAERVAIHTAVANGRRRLTAIAVVGPAGITLTPCGACRQVMEEFGLQTVIIAAPRGAPAVVSLPALLPIPFTRGWVQPRHAGL
jgi:cytidine deaminase